jgi:hypothetical protein
LSSYSVQAFSVLLENSLSITSQEPDVPEKS